MAAWNFSFAFSGSFDTTAIITAPAMALAVSHSPGGTAWRLGGARLSPAKKAAAPLHPAGVLISAFSAFSNATRRLGSVGCAIHRSVASSDSLILGSGSGPAARLAVTQAHHTPSRFGRACAT